VLKATLCSFAALLLIPAAADAQVRISGFGQVLAGTTTSDGTTLAGFDDEIDFRNGSLFAVQISADLNDRVTATGQIVARGSNDFEPKFSWAYAKIQATDGVSIILGRQRNPIYRYSDFLDVGYAYPWALPPLSVYNTGIDNIDGASISWNKSVGDWNSEAKLLIGGYEGSVGSQGQVGKLSNAWTLAWELGYDNWFLARATLLRTDFSLTTPQLEGLFGALRQAGLSNVVSALDAVDVPTEFRSMAVEIDRGSWFLLGEVTKSADIEDSFLPSTSNKYVALGARAGEFTPYVAWGKRDSDVKLQIAGLIPSNNPLRAAIVGLISSPSYKDTYLSAGVRWDFTSNTAFKFDYTRLSTDIVGRKDAGLITTGLVFTF
jgi:hypothetical protein